ncbi:Aste57867_17542 [Aphanomyces stellatus]|uniref:Aste57867_17542 protein n=1 Tax=Aphanomyces stellatus TaxID=120398 RepID=A0A485LBM2_9STRA|nr:hypothetical protein As57867_017482 [Aphanomyces stellatus]VFT94295.1 Aste57867_17542 [Aphanomyces stellatus]
MAAGPIEKQVLSAAIPGTSPSATTWIFVLFCMINMLNFMDRGIIPGAPTQFQYFIKETLNISVADESKYVGLLASSFIASYAGFILLFGYLSIFVKPFHLVAVGLFVWCLAVIVCGLAKPSNSFYVLLAGRIVSGIGESSFQCIAPPFIDDHAPAASRTLWLGIFFSCISVGTAVGYEYGALLANSSWGWDWAFYWEAICMCPLALTCLCGIPAAYNRAGDHHHHDHMPLPTDDLVDEFDEVDDEIKDTRADDDDEDRASTTRSSASTSSMAPQAGGSARPPFFQEIASVLNNAVFVLTVFGTAAFTFSLAGLSVFGPMFLIGLGLFEKETEASMVFGGVVVLSGLVGTPLGGLFLDRACHHQPDRRQFLALRQTFWAMTIGTTLALFAWCMLPNKFWFLFLLGLALSFLFASTSANAIVILLCVDPSRRSLAVGVNTLFLHLLGDVPSPIILGMLKDAWAPHCGSIELNGTVVLNPDCARDFQGLLMSLLFPLLWMIWSVVSYGAATYLVQRRMRQEGHDI